MSDDINLASLWVPVMAETSHIKGQLSAAGAEGAAIFAQAFTGSGVFKDLGKQLQASLGTGLPSGLLQGFDGLTGRTKAAEDALRSYQKAHESLTAALAREQIAQSRLNDLQEANVTGTRLLSAQAALESAHRRVAAATDADTEAQTAHQAALDATGSKMLALSTIANGVGIASIVGFTAAVGSSVKAAGDFQASMTRLTASAGESVGNIQAVNDGILQMAGNVGYGPQQLADAMYNVEKAGYRGAAGVNVLTAAAQGANSEQADLKDVLSGLTTSMHDFAFSEDQAADVMSKMVAATALARTNFQDFSGGLHSAEPLIANIGKSQGLTSQQLQHLMSDLYGVGAQMTQTGMSASNAFELINHATGKLLGPTAGMRDMMGALGLDAQDLSDHLGERGVAGTMQILVQAIQQHTKDGKVDLDVHYQSAQAARAEAEAFGALPAPAKAVAEQIKNGTLSYKEFRTTRGGLSVEMANELGQWNALNNKLTGFSSAIKSGIGDQMSLDQALKTLTGDQETLQVALATTGDNTDQTNDKIAQIDQTTREHDGTVKGFTETQKTFNAQMRDFKSAIESARIELGTAFLPALTDVAKALADVGKFLADHKTLAEGLTFALGGIATAWIAIKAAMIGKEVFDAVAGGFNFVLDAATKTMDGTVAKVLSADEAFRGIGPAAEEGSTGVEGAMDKDVESIGKVTTAANEADAALRGIGAAAEEGTEGLATATTEQEALLNTETEDIERRNTAMGGGLPGTPKGEPEPRPPSGLPLPLPVFVPIPHDLPGHPDPVIPKSGKIPSNITTDSTYHAAGGLFGTMPTSAVIQPATKGLVQWAEPSTQGEAFIPLSGGDKSIKIWAQTGHLLGVFDQGGILAAGNAGSLSAGGDKIATAGAQIDTIGISEALNQMFPSIASFGLYRGPDGYDEHSSGEAVDVSPGGIGTPATGAALEMGNQISQAALANASAFGVEYTIWQNKLWYPDGHSENYGQDPSNTTQAHMDHVHIRTAGGGFPPGGGPGSGGSALPHTGTTSNIPAPGAAQMMSGGAFTMSGGGAAFGSGGFGSGGFGGGGGMPAGATAGIGPGGESGYYMADEKKVSAAEERIAKADARVKDLEERQSELKSDAAQSERDKLRDDLNFAKEDADKARQALAEAQQGDFHRAGRGREGEREGGDKTESQAQELGSGLLKGALSDLGFGNVLGGKSPLDWGIVKLLGGLAGWGIGEANSWADSQMGGGQAGDQGGASGGGSPFGGLLTGALDAIPGVKGLMPRTGNVALAPSPVSGVPTPSVSSGQGGGPAPGPVTYDNRIQVQGNTVADPGQFLPAIQEAQNARAGGSSGGMNGSMPYPASH